MSNTALPRKSPSLLLLLTALLFLAGCGRTAPVSYYQLAPLARGEFSSRPGGGTALVIGIGPIRLQEHLDRPQLVLRTGASRLQLADRHRWAEPLAANIAWVLRDNLAALLATEEILLHPWEQTTPLSHQVSLDILRCEGGADGAGHLEALWRLSDGEGRELQPPQRSSYQVAVTTPDEEGLVKALSEALARLSREIAAELLNRGTNSGPRHP